ncbi:hypothetical protein [uncultured Devosia sp.]|uniref:hypothetical protein n=1 Tax=uncultured Devosia sp. TaxID=211434 RepID=UPI0026022BBB|nr:hypothetical protein [uncultured Devosia sp.]
MERTLFTYSEIYPKVPGFKRGDTSHDAAKVMRERAPTLRERVLGEFRAFGPMTPDECATSLRASILSIRPRVSELVADGLVVDTGARRMNESGMSAKVYRVPE